MVSSTKEVSSLVRFGLLGTCSGFFSPNSKRPRMVTIWFTLFSTTSFVVVVAAVLFSIFRYENLTSVSQASSISVFLFTQMTSFSLGRGTNFVSLHDEQLSAFLSTCCLCFFGEKHTAITEESCFCTVNEKYSDPFEETMVELTFCRYPMRHGALDGVGKVAAVPVGVLSARIAGEGVVELAGEGTKIAF